MSDKVLAIIAFLVAQKNECVAMKNIAITLSLLCVFFACSCSNEPQQSQKPSDATLDFVGCYTDTPSTPAQIKITHDGTNYHMQMKEPSTAKDAWDTPEMLHTVNISDEWQHFSINTLNLEQSDIQAIITRPDGIMSLAKVHSASANVNPLLDSEFVVRILNHTNTIYATPCDDERLALQ